MPPQNVLSPRRVLRIVRARQIQPGGCFEIVAAMLAIAHARSVPAVDENAIHPIAGHNLLFNLGHELKVVWPQPAGDPHFRGSPVPARLALRINRNPIRMRLIHILVGGVRIGSSDDHHAQLPAPCHQFAKRIGITQPLAAMMKRNLCRIIRHAAAGAQTGRIRMRASEVIEPKLQIEFPRVILNQRELRPAHGLLNPSRGRRRAGRR